MEESTCAFDIYRNWHRDVASRHGPNTVRLYRYYVLRFLADSAKHPLKITKPELEKYLDGLTPQHSKAVRGGLRDFLTFLVRRGYRGYNPLETIKVKSRGGKRIRRGLSEEEVIRLLISTVTLSGDRMGWSVLAQYSLGLRPGEMVNLKAEQVNLNGDSSCVYVVQTKTGNDRIVPMNSDAKEALRELLAYGEGNLVGIGRTQYWTHIKRAAAVAGLPPEKQRPYALRHTFATRLAEKNVPPRLIAELLGHSDMRHMWTYTTPSDGQLKEAVEQLRLF